MKYKKFEILEDNSSCCSVCYEMLEAGVGIYIDKDNDIICQECIND